MTPARVWANSAKLETSCRWTDSTPWPGWENCVRMETICRWADSTLLPPQRAPSDTAWS